MNPKTQKNTKKTTLMPIIIKLLQISQEKGKLRKRKCRGDREDRTLDMKRNEISE